MYKAHFFLKTSDCPPHSMGGLAQQKHLVTHQVTLAPQGHRSHCQLFWRSARQIKTAVVTHEVTLAPQGQGTARSLVA